jgi:hypothetical protein
MRRDTRAVVILGLAAGVFMVFVTCAPSNLLFMGLIAWGAILFFRKR